MPTFRLAPPPRLAVWLLALIGSLFAAAAPARAQEPPDATVKRVAQEMVGLIRSDPQIQNGNQARIREVLETKLLPHFDFTRMAALAMGRNWRSATPEQQKRLTDEFRSLLVRTYSGALNQYRDENIEVKPLRANPGDTDVVVHSVVVRKDKPPVQMDYGMEKTNDGWKCYDVIVGGVSLVTNYRDEFNEQVKSGGIDGLIDALANRNKGAPAK